MLWGLVVYAPVAHWVWGGGFLAQLGALDFAGGTVVHINAGAAALVAALVLGPRKDYARQAILPHNVPFTLLGAGLLWFGWFGFNGGSALASNASGGPGLRQHDVRAGGDARRLDAARPSRGPAAPRRSAPRPAIVVGLVAVTPAAGFVSPLSAILLGGVAAFPSYFALLWRARTRLDDSLDVVAAHGLGGTVGALLTGRARAEDLERDGRRPALRQPAPARRPGGRASSSSLAYSGVATFGLLKLVAAVVPLRAGAREEGLGLDVTQHGEEAYTRGEGAILVLPERVRPTGRDGACRRLGGRRSPREAPA